MSAPRKLNGNTKSELTRFKELWRDTFTDAQRDYWRAQFLSKTPTREIRESLKVKFAINLSDDDQIVRFRKWDKEERQRQEESERMVADEQFYRQAHPEWNAEQLREEVIKSAMLRGLATGNHALGLTAVRVGQQEESAKFTAALEKAKLELSKQARQQAADELELQKEKFKEGLRTKLETGLAELATHIKGNPAAKKAYDEFRATIKESTK